MQTIQQIQNEIIDEFDFFEDWSEKYQYLIDLGKNLPNFDNKSRIDSNLIKGCQSKVWLNSSFKDNTVIFEADSDAIISKGIISLLIRVFSGHRPEDIAASAQAHAELEIEKIIGLAANWGTKLCYAGGVALNCVANSKILHHYFKDVWIYPNPGDAGSSLGAALAFNRKKIEYTPYLGTNIDHFVNPKVVVTQLLKDKVVGIANGKAEFGPRALGNRSLLGDVRYDIKRTVNKIKRRQQFRPFAPAILSEYADEYFDGPMNKYMQYTSQAKHDYKSVTHVDNSARVQLVTPSCKTILRPILEEYYERTGVPMLLNTSLNIKGQPIVDNWQDAIDFSKKYGVQVF